MHDVRVQIVDVFGWVCPRGGELRDGSAIQGSVFFCSQDWRFPVADGCAGLQLFFFLRGWSPHAWLSLLASPPCAAWSIHILRCRSSHRVSSLLICVHLSSSPVFFLFLQCGSMSIPYSRTYVLAGTKFGTNWPYKAFGWFLFRVSIEGTMKHMAVMERCWLASHVVSALPTLCSPSAMYVTDVGTARSR